MELDYIIKKLNLVPLPEEGGYFHESFRSHFTVKVDYDGKEVERKAATCIYYLITPDDFSAIHKVKGEEIFHFYFGDPVEMVHLTEAGPKKIILGNRLEKGEIPQVIVPSGVWQGTRLCEGGKLALLGCSVSPGFEYEDFTIAGREELSRLYPECLMEIIRYTRF
jgi:predicted cupin superfamily sugar epimerase